MEDDEGEEAEEEARAREPKSVHWRWWGCVCAGGSAGVFGHLCWQAAGAGGDNRRLEGRGWLCPGSTNAKPLGCGLHELPCRGRPDRVVAAPAGWPSPPTMHTTCTHRHPCARAHAPPLPLRTTRTLHPLPVTGRRPSSRPATKSRRCRPSPSRRAAPTRRPGRQRPRRRSSSSAPAAPTWRAWLCGARWVDGARAGGLHPACMCDGKGRGVAVHKLVGVVARSWAGQDGAGDVNRCAGDCDSCIPVGGGTVLVWSASRCTPRSLPALLSSLVKSRCAYPPAHLLATAPLVLALRCASQRGKRWQRPRRNASCRRWSVWGEGISGHMGWREVLVMGNAGVGD